jgi:hypothetical protein
LLFQDDNPRSNSDPVAKATRSPAATRKAGQGRRLGTLSRPHTGLVVSDSAVGHREAARRHEVAAEQHERAARFWDEQRDRERAGLRRVMAAYERLGAELEHRWAELVDPDAADSEARAAELVIRPTRQGAKQASAILMQLANTLERSAALAEEHAQRRERAGRTEDVAAEREAAQRARAAAQRARSQADEWTG